MARVILAMAAPHNCVPELETETASWLNKFNERLTFGSVLECSCGRWYELRFDQREGRFWRFIMQGKTG